MTNVCLRPEVLTCGPPSTIRRASALLSACHAYACFKLVCVCILFLWQVGQLLKASTPVDSRTAVADEGMEFFDFLDDSSDSGLEGVA